VLIRRLLLFAAVLALAAPAVAFGEEPPPGSTWHEEYFRSGDGVNLHADVLRPSNLPASAKTPVIVTVSPYTNHATDHEQTYDPNASGPSSRFFDFLAQGKVFERGYTYVICPGPEAAADATTGAGPASRRRPRPRSNGRRASRGRRARSRCTASPTTVGPG
jgi:X-Pro dipeptidyl-peptidase-like protein